MSTLDSAYDATNRRLTTKDVGTAGPLADQFYDLYFILSNVIDADGTLRTVRV